MEYVYEVYKEKSFSKAAANLYISQPSLSATIKKIEERIGTPLFDRSTNPIQLTDCGKEYVKCMEKIIDIENGFENYLNNIDELKTGRLAIGGSNFFTSFVLPPLVSKYMQKYPFIQISLMEANTSQLEHQLIAGALDFVIDNYAFNETIYSRHFLNREQLLLAVPRHFSSNESVLQYQLSKDDIVTGRHHREESLCVPLEVFRNDPFIFLRSGNDTRERADKICSNHGFAPHVILKLDQQLSAYNVACYGMGIAFVSDTLIQHSRPDENIVFYKLRDPETVRNVYFYHKQSRYITRAMEEFLKIALPDPGM
jgi:DNA-binding transcriptional LysR family regulator